MTIEFVGADALEDLFDIIVGNFVSREEFEKRDKDLASSINVGSALIAAALLKVAEAMESVKGGEGGESTGVYDGGNIGEEGETTTYDGGDVDVDETIRAGDTSVNDGGSLDEEDEEVVVFDGGEI